MDESFAIRKAWTFLKEEVRLRGSTGAALRTLPDGRKVVVKRGGRAGGNPAAHIKNEFDMNRYLHELGVGVPDAQMTYEHDSPTMLTEWEEGARPARYSDKGVLREDFVPNALIGNWDVLGQEMDNTLIRPDGTPTYVDVGGAGPFRAQGAPKGDKWNANLRDLETMQYLPPHTSEVYGNMSEEELGQSYDRYGGVDAMTDATKVVSDPQTQGVLQQRAENLARRVA